MVETVIVSGVLLVSLMLLFQMINHFTFWWRKQENDLDRTASARYAIQTVDSMLSMAGYKASVRGVHSISPTGITIEYRDDDREEDPETYSRHRLYRIFRDGSKLKLTDRRRLLPLEGPPSWGEGSTSVLAEGIEEVDFRYFDRTGAETADPALVRLVVFTMGYSDKGARYQTAVCLRNYNG